MTDANQWSAFLNTFHEQFPVHVGKRRRQAMFALAQKILTEEIPAARAEALIDRSILKKLIRAADKSLVMFLVFIGLWAWTMLIEPTLDKDRIENPETRQRFFETLFEQFDQALNDKSEEVWPFPGSLFEQTESAVPLQNSPTRIPKPDQKGICAAPTRVRRKPANPSRSKRA